MLVVIVLMLRRGEYESDSMNPVNYNLKNCFLQRISAKLTLCKDDEFIFNIFYSVHWIHIRSKFSTHTSKNSSLHFHNPTNLIIFKGDGLASLSPFKGSMCPIIHLIEPVVGVAEPSLIVHHANCQVAAVHIQNNPINFLF